MTMLVKEKPVKPAPATPPTSEQRLAILTRAEQVPCTCPERCERDHDNE